MNTLIVYASKHGCTEKCAQLVAKELHNKTDIINLNTQENIDISKYDKVIIGGSIYIGKIQKAVSQFCSTNLNELKRKKIGLFICGMQEGDAITTEINQNFPAELINIAAAKEHLGGEFVFAKMNFVEKFIVKKVSKTSTDKSNILTDNISKLSLAMNGV